MHTKESASSSSCWSATPGREPFAWCGPLGLLGGSQFLVVLVAHSLHLFSTQLRLQLPPFGVRDTDATNFNGLAFPASHIEAQGVGRDALPERIGGPNERRVRCF